MSKDKLTDYSATNSLNTDIGGVNIDEGMLPSDVNNALREVMTHLKDFAEGTQAVNNIKFAGATTTGDINFGDNDKAIFGAGSDLQIYHDGLHSYIEDQGTGNLYVKATNLRLNNSANVSYLSADSGGAVSVYHNGSQKLATTATGADITGTLTADGLTVDGASVFNQAASDQSGGAAVKANGTAYGTNKSIHAYMNTSNAAKSLIYAENGAGSVFNIDGAGDISFYDSTGTTQGFFWDASTQRLGLGTTSPSSLLHLASGASSAQGIKIENSGGSTNGDAILQFTTPALTTTIGIDATGTDIFKISNSSALGTSDVLAIDSSGNVGIGTASVDNKLHLENAGTLYLQIENTSTANKFYLGNSGGNAILESTGAYSMNFKTNGSERMRIDSSGNVGIGTASPAVPLHIYHATTNGVARFESGDATALVQFKDSGTTLVPPSIGAVSNDLVVQINNSEAARFDSSGNVGIGTASPSDKLHVEGDIRVNNAIESPNNLNLEAENGALRFYTGSGSPTEAARIDSSGNLLVGTSTQSSNGSHKVVIESASTVGTISSHLALIGDGATAGEGPQILFSESGNGTAWAGGTIGFVRTGGNSVGDLVFGTRQTTGDINTTTTEAMRIDSSGNLLVGYTSSNGAYKLQVNSQIFATSATIATSDGNYKENITPLDGALSLVSQLNPVQFDWKEHPVHEFDRNQPTIGFIAQEVQQVLAEQPYLNSIVKSNECVLEPEETDGEGNVIKEAVTESFLGIAEGNMVALLTAALQEALTKIDDLESRVAALEAN